MKVQKKAFSKNSSMGVLKSLKDSNERMARRQLMEELFYDFHRSRRQIFGINFVRGIFFGFGTVLGGTVLVALLVWLLSRFASWFPFIGNFINQLINAIRG